MIRCHYCPRVTLLSEEGARFRGWRIYSGLSVTGKEIRDVICLKCSGRGTVEEDEELIPSWDIMCKTCGWQFSDEWDRNLIPVLDERDAYTKAQMHHCTPEFQYMDQGGRQWLDQAQLDERIIRADIPRDTVAYKISTEVGADIKQLLGYTQVLPSDTWPDLLL